MRVICWSCYQCTSAKRRSQTSMGSKTRGSFMGVSRESEEAVSGENGMKSRGSSGFDEASQIDGILLDGCSCEKEDPKIPEDVFSDVELLPEMSILEEPYWGDDNLNHVYQILSYHPKYLDTFLAFHNYTLHGQCPLPREYRHYLAIMAASRHSCSFLVTMETAEFLSVGGPKEWLTGLEHAPSMLGSLKEINKIMAHRPWLLTSDHIKKVMSSGENWSLSSLGHAVILLAHFHSLSSFVLASGVAVFSEDENIESSSSGSEGDSLSVSSDIEVETIMARINKLQEVGSHLNSVSRDQLRKNYETIESQSSELPLKRRKRERQTSTCLSDDSDYHYEDFASRPNNNSISALQARDYSWQDHGFCFSNLLVTEAGEFLDKRFSTAQKLTYNTLGNHREVDTSKFRQAVWNIVQCMFGMCHDDFNYMIIDLLLDKKTKTFIKMAACHPERVNGGLYGLFGKELKLSEKIHINILIMEARLQAEILYAMRAISQYRSYGH